MKRGTAKLRISWTLLILWMVVIFAFSAKNGTESDKQSELVIYVFNALGLNLDSLLGDLATFIVRKTAHFTEYLILFGFAYNLLKNYTSKKLAIIYGVMLTFGYACTDEFHQIFVPGRTAKFRDVLIDTAGALFGSVVLYCRNIFKLKYSNSAV
ncbi:VanZ family protein [Clostridium sp. C8-1-8]|uniref:VanZ family protein n=1 Tax=Clostridium sp. C8-1-8 TaxID=2698831 RepID=UPI001371AE2B|nr:VanZ family protein [Clostridium sp. C8-1-8]